MRVWIGSLAVAVLLLPGQAIAAEPPHALAGSNTVTGHEDGRLDVTVGQDAIIDLTPSTDSDGQLSPEALHIDGEAADFAGFVLTERGTTDGFLAVALRTPEPIRDGDDVYNAFAYGQLAQQDRGSTGETDCVRCPIPAGDYHLYLLTDEDTAITINIEGLDGRAALTIDERIYPWGTDFDPHEFDVIGAGGGGQLTSMASSNDGPGLFINTYRLTVTSDTPTVALAQDCRGSGDDEQCQEHVLADGGDAVGGMHVTTDAAIEEGVYASMSYDVVGIAHVAAATDLLWLPLDVSDGFRFSPSPEPDPPDVSFESFIR